MDITIRASFLPHNAPDVLTALLPRHPRLRGPRRRRIQRDASGSRPALPTSPARPSSWRRRSPTPASQTAPWRSPRTTPVATETAKAAPP